METYQELAIQEKDRIDASIQELVEFLNSRRADKVPREDLNLMWTQLSVMESYSVILACRIEGF